MLSKMIGSATLLALVALFLPSDARLASPAVAEDHEMVQFPADESNEQHRELGSTRNFRFAWINKGAYTVDNVFVGIFDPNDNFIRLKEHSGKTDLTVGRYFRFTIDVPKHDYYIIKVMTRIRNGSKPYATYKLSGSEMADRGALCLYNGGTTRNNNGFKFWNIGGRKKTDAAIGKNWECQGQGVLQNRNSWPFDNYNK